MCWIAETENGTFEAESLKGLSENIAIYYARECEQICDIAGIYWENAWGLLSTLSQKGLNIFINDCELSNIELLQNYKEEDEGLRELKSNYYASVL